MSTHHANTSRAVHALLCLAALLYVGGYAAGQPIPAGTVQLRQALAIPAVGRYGRTVVHQDAIEARLVAGTWTPPRSGEVVTLPDGTRQAWAPITADASGWFSDPALEGGYAYVTYDSPSRRVMLLEAEGDNVVYVNGEPRAGDPYSTGYVSLPVQVRAGWNWFLFQVGRGKLRARLVPPRAEAIIDTRDATLPDRLAGETLSGPGAVLIVNATGTTLQDLYVTTDTGAFTAVPRIPPLSVRKVGFDTGGVPPGVRGSGFGVQGSEQDKLTIRLELTRGAGRRPLDTATVTLRVRQPGQTYKRTFVSGIDGSVQYYAVNPASPLGGRRTEDGGRTEQGRRPALVLTLHGAGVEAIGQADAYESKPWCYLVAPTNRRPYGFDWEDWGRVDALEVLGAARAELRTDPERVYLTGHSMGGHGVWQIGATLPDLFAAIGPSAGWISFSTYLGAKPPESSDPVQQMVQRASSPSDTLALIRNYLQQGVYILHGSADDNVPVTEAQEMAKRLAEFHHDYIFYVQQGAGHWWDISDEPGADCVDWAPMFDMFARHAVREDDEVRHVEFHTASPGVSARCHWLTIEAQDHVLQPSSADIRWDPGKRRFVGTTSNVARLALLPPGVRQGETVQIELDRGGEGEKGRRGQEKAPHGERGAGSEQTGTGNDSDTTPPATQGSGVSSSPLLPFSPSDALQATMPSSGPIWLVKQDERWVQSLTPAASLKGPARYGPFKQAFGSRMVFVYGTRGTAEENAWALSKARYDAETFWVRGNGSVDVLPDTAFHPTEDQDRSVILYGNADTNGAWKPLLSGSPVQTTRDHVVIGGRPLLGSDLACLFLRPRPGSDHALVGVVSGTGLPGMRLTDRLPYFLSGVGYPDCTVIGTDALTQGIAGIRATGFFGVDWSVETGEWGWR